MTPAPLLREIPPGLRLDTGKHDPDDGKCLFELVAWIAGEPHTDHPKCASPVLGVFGRSLNDQLPDDLRQQLLPFAPRIVGTADDGLDETRAYLALDWLIRTYTPAWLDLAGLTEDAQTLRDLRRIADLAAVQSAGPAVRSARDKAAAARAAGDAGDAAWAAARVAGDAARVAGDAARAAGDAGDAAWAAARAAGDAAWAAAWDALAPTVRQLQESAIDLLDRMIDGRWAT